MGACFLPRCHNSGKTFRPITDNLIALKGERVPDTKATPAHELQERMNAGRFVCIIGKGRVTGIQEPVILRGGKRERGLAWVYSWILDNCGTLVDPFHSDSRSAGKTSEPLAHLGTRERRRADFKPRCHVAGQQFDGLGL